MSIPWLQIGQAGASIASQLLANNANRRAQERANAYNKDAANTAYEREMGLLKFQLDYNSPTSQMKRFKDAGLNPNLVYGQGTPGNLQSVPNVPVQAPAHANQVSFIAPELLQMVQQSRLMEAQTENLNQRTNESGVRQDLIKAQTELTKANPYLNANYVDAMVMQAEARARLLDQQKRFSLAQVSTMTPNGIEIRERGLRMMQEQYEQLFKKSGLMDADAKIKAQILESKEFQNLLNDMQESFIKSGEIDGETFRQGFLLFLNRLRMQPLGQ